jgi:predicted TIM-barrel fold metal-dependent hydrolase
MSETIQTATSNDRSEVEPASGRIIIVSVDGHVGPTLERDLRPYCEKQYLQEYDEFSSGTRSPWTRQMPGFRPTESTLQAIERTVTCAGQNDPHARLKDLDDQGIAAEVVFGGGQNGERIPFMGEGLGHVSGPGASSTELQAVGLHIYNQWLADFLTVEPSRHIGLVHVPIWDVPATVDEVEWGRKAGLRGVNFPAPRSNFPAFNSPIYEPLWAACETLDMPLCCHAGGGDDPLGTTDPGGHALFSAEINWLGRRGLWQLIFGGVFERHPKLKLVLTEQRAAWMPPTLRNLDSIYFSELGSELRAQLPRSPSEYWSTNCYIGGSYPSPFEVSLRHEIGVSNLMWGADYPHQEGTWPNTLLAIRHAFHGIPERDTRQILGQNAIGVFGLDSAEMRALADRIGPTPDDVAEPVERFPEHRGLAFREYDDFH